MRVPGERNFPGSPEKRDSKGTHNYGIDLMRIVAMFCIVVLHMLSEGGIAQHVETFSMSYYAYLTVRFFCEFAVNGFVLITGYVMVFSKPKFKRLFSLWLQVLFYSAGISLLFICCGWDPSLDVRHEIYSMLLPLTSRRYWFISSYMVLSLFIPLLNAGIEKLSRKEFRRLLISFFLLISVFGNLNFDRTDPFCMNTGASPLWLIYLYLIGAYTRKYDVPSQIHFRWAILVSAGCIALNVLFKDNMDRYRWKLPYTLDWMLMNHISITYVIISFSILCIFAKIKPGKKLSSAICFLSPAVLGVYLIHVHPLVWKNCIPGLTMQYVNSKWFIMVPQVLFTALKIFIFCLGIELIRIRLFDLVWRGIERILNRIRH